MTMPDRAVVSLYKRLAEEAAEFERWERHRQASRRRRNLLIAKLITAGETTRAVGAVAKVSSAGISQMMAAEMNAEAGRAEGSHDC